MTREPVYRSWYGNDISTSVRLAEFLREDDSSDSHEELASEEDDALPSMVKVQQRIMNIT